MTEGRRRRGPRPTTVILASVAAFLAILAFLAFQLRMGRDPALTKVPKPLEVKPQPRQLVVRKIVRKYVITRVIPAPEPAYSGGPAVAVSLPASSGSSGSAPVAPSSPAPVSAAPAPAAPAPVAAPAPAPAPVSRAS
jgi:hypothetical protein